ncbi:MAG: hypothetical protein AB1742_07965 [bacterium]
MNKVTEKQKEDILVFVGEKFEAKIESKLEVLEEKFERRLAEEIAKVRVELGEKISGVKSELEVKIAQTKSEIIKWMFIFWAGQIGVITGLLFAFSGRL